MRKIVWLGLAMAVVLTGCGKSAAPTPPPITPAPPAATVGGGCVSPGVDQVVPRAFMAPPTNKVVLSGLCESVVAAEGFAVGFMLPPDADEAVVRAAIKTDGATPDRVDVAPGQAYVIFGAGKPGEVVTVRLAGPLGPDGAAVDLGYRLTRKASPTITAEVRSGDGAWAPLVSPATLPRASLAIRFTLKGSPNRDIIISQLKQALEPRKDDAFALTYQLDAISPDTLLLTIPAPPPKLEIPIYNGPDPDGIDIRPFYMALYTGEAPRLVAFDPVTGAEKTLGEAPVDVLSSYASPDGKWILLDALADANNRDVWLVDARTGQMRRTELAPSWFFGNYYWVGDRLVVPSGSRVQVMDLATLQVTRTQSAADYFMTISPDQRLLGGLRPDGRREDPKTFIAPTTIVVHDWQTGKEEVYKDVAQTPIHHGESPSVVPMNFSCDGSKLSWPEGQTGHWRTLDRQTGQVKDEPAGVTPGCPTTPQPAGKGWSFQQQGPWTPITIKTPDGKSVSAGSGLMLGWQPDGKALIIRWPNGAYARHPGI